MTDKEKMQALLDGKKLGSEQWDKDDYVRLRDGALINECGHDSVWDDIEAATHILGEKPLTIKEMLSRWWRNIDDGWNGFYLVDGFRPNSKYVYICDGWHPISDLSDPDKWESKTDDEIQQMMEGK